MTKFNERQTEFLRQSYENGASLMLAAPSGKAIMYLRNGIAMAEIYENFIKLEPRERIDLADMFGKENKGEL